MNHVRYNIYTSTPSAAFIYTRYTKYMCQIITIASYCHDICTFYHLADAFIQCSVYEGFMQTNGKLTSHNVEINDICNVNLIPDKVVCHSSSNYRLHQFHKAFQ